MVVLLFYNKIAICYGHDIIYIVNKQYNGVTNILASYFLFSKLLYLYTCDRISQNCKVFDVQKIMAKSILRPHQILC